MKKSLATIFMVAALTTGCGGSTGGQNVQPGPTSTQSATTPAAPVFKVLTKKALTNALLGIDALPVGYSQDPPSKASDKTFCDYKVPHQPKTQVAYIFTKGSGFSGEVASVGIRQFATPSDAAESFKALTDALATCKSETYQDEKLTYRLMSAPKVGDGSVGVRIESDGSTILQQFALVGPALVNAGIGAVVNVDGDQTAALLEAQVKKYEAAAQK